jgi:hypothetical protein
MQDAEIAAYLVALASLAVAAFALVRWRRAVRIMGTRILIGEAMRRRGITPADAQTVGLEAEVLAAQGRCANCRMDTSCRMWLADAGAGGLPDGCPNRDFFERVEVGKSALKQ